ncbi:hypothetical protein FISHEDRAFT_50054, partial [Fistulina hepatica ATCC 64428]
MQDNASFRYSPLLDIEGTCLLLYQVASIQPTTADFDASSDTPVETLHVILLGFVKYFWRDTVSRQDEGGKRRLKARIDSFDVAGLGVDQPRGTTLVKYAGSLTGRDFRVILQIAPFILYDLSPIIYEAWQALGHLGALVFRPVIHETAVYLIALKDAINDFLGATALWSTRWFNKPKFHVLIHLTKHVERFGPPLLYATE